MSKIGIETKTIDSFLSLLNVSNDFSFSAYHVGNSIFWVILNFI